MERPLDAPYFEWLCAKVVIGEGPSPSYYKLLKVLYDTEFVWTHLGDDNRAADGLDLRLEFLRATRLEKDDIWFDVGCSVLEMLIAFSRRAAFQTDLTAKEWFWKFIINLNLADFNDDGPFDRGCVEDILYNFVWRTYDYDGTGGLFPMNDPPEDQTEVELWYQLGEYVVEQGL